MGNYPALAKLMSQHPDLLILRNFRDLNVKSLLYYEAELAYLEQELQEVEEEDAKDPVSTRKHFLVCWKSLSGAQDTHVRPADFPIQTSRDVLQWQIFSRIRLVLEKYNDALIRQSRLSEISSAPHQADFSSLREWLDRPGYGNSFLRATTEGVWDVEKGFDDFVTLKALQRSATGFTSMLARAVLSCRRSLTQSKSPVDHVYALRESSENWITSGTMTVVSSVFPVLPIVILFFIDRLLVRLGLILVFTAGFAAVLTFGIRMTPDQVLAITTAFAAIQVVFVGSNSRIA